MKRHNKNLNLSNFLELKLTQLGLQPEKVKGTRSFKELTAQRQREASMLASGIPRSDDDPFTIPLPNKKRNDAHYIQVMTVLRNHINNVFGTTNTDALDAFTDILR